VITYGWRGPFTNAEANALHAEGFGHRCADDDWQAQLDRHSLGWVCAREDGGLAAFVNVAWDGGSHAFIHDTLVAGRLQRRGVGTGLVAFAVAHARAAGASGCTWTSKITFARSTSAVVDSGQPRWAYRLVTTQPAMGATARQSHPVLTRRVRSGIWRGIGL
jgi:GNAT superfamily N-acetyltransferase